MTLTLQQAKLLWNKTNPDQYTFLQAKANSEELRLLQFHAEGHLNGFIQALIITGKVKV